MQSQQPKVKSRKTLMVSLLPFLQRGKKLSLRDQIFYRIIFPVRVKTAVSITTPFHYLKDQLITHYHIAPEKITVVPPVAEQAFVPVSQEEQTEVKEKCTAGYAYFIFYGDMHRNNNITGLLKSFSTFKKWQQSNMKLLLAGNIPKKDCDEAIHKLSSYKYKDDVILMPMPSTEELAKITGAAYALLMPSLYNNNIIPLLNAIACSVPVIASDTPSTREVLQGRILYIEPNNVQSIANQMILLYKNEALHERLSMMSSDS